VSLAGEPSFREVVQRVRRAAVDAYDHGNIPFDLVVDAVTQERELGIAPIFQAMCIHQSQALESPRLNGLTTTLRSVDERCTKFDLMVEIDPARRAVEIEYSEDLFERATVTRMLRQLSILIDSATSSADAPIGTLSLLDGPATSLVKRQWNDTE